ncbi:MAG TPA: carbohydrate-binding family 9-like protein [Fimbriimonas sp.]|nr:carbohydrate-binding family 9-like protein [Fimbriimonas sp.]
MHSFPAPIPYPKTYVCLRADRPIELSGRVDGPEWEHAPWTDYFLDIQGESLPIPRFKTRAKMLWDDERLYIAAHMQEPYVWGTLREHDSVIFHDNDFEVFVDPDGDGHLYAEMEMNVLNTTWDLLLVKPYRAGGPPVNGWEMHGMRTAVNVDGACYHPSDPSHGWSVNISIPWTVFAEISRTPCPPKDGDHWRINFSRVEWQIEVVNGEYQKLPNHPEDNWVWSPQHVIDMHWPERWGILQFSGSHMMPVEVRDCPGVREKMLLGQVWEAQSAFRREHGRWAATTSELHVPEGVEIQATSELFEASYQGYCVDHSLRFWKQR